MNAESGAAATVAQLKEIQGANLALKSKYASTAHKFLVEGETLAHTPENVRALRWYLQTARDALARYKYKKYTGAGVATQTNRIAEIIAQLAKWGIKE